MSLSKLRTPESQSLSSQVAESLRDAIVDGTLRPGERLVEAAIAEQMGVSRGPVREAIMDLERQGWVTHIPRRGAYVAKWSMQDIEELYTLRMVLEGLSARLATLKITPEKLEELTGIVEALGQTRDVDRSVELDQSFHCQLCVAADHPPLKETLVGMQLQTTLFIRRTHTSDVMGGDSLTRRAKDHGTILEAVRSGDPALAERRMREHIESSGLRLVSRLQSEGAAAE